IPGGDTTQWTQVDANTWQVSNRAGGKVQVAYKLSLKGDTLNSDMAITKPDGGVVKQTAVMTRIAGGPGLSGTWKSSQVKAAAVSMEIAANGADGVTLSSADFGFTIAAKFDGKEYRNTGPTPDSTIYVFKSLGPTSFEMTQKLDGKASYVDTY